jgi:penicillin-binding protein 1A
MPPGATMKMHATGGPEQPPAAYVKNSKHGKGRPPKPAPKPKQAGDWVVSIIKWFFVLLLAGCAVGCATIALTFWMYGRDPKLPNLSKLDDYQFKRVTTILDSSDRRIGELGSEHRTVVAYDKIPPVVIDAFVAAEDNHFWTHAGVDYVGMGRAFIHNVFAGHTTQGASTITQQVVKNMVLTPERTFKRKIQEIILARRLEQTLTKQEIMSLYLNQIYFGHNRYGVEEAARYYFGKDIWQVDVGEAALLASLPKNPNGLTRRDPAAYQRVKARQEYVLKNMVAIGKLPADQLQKWLDAPIKFIDKPFDQMARGVAPEWIDLVHDAMLREVLGPDANLQDKAIRKEGDDKIDELGHEVRTTLDVGLQTIAKKALQDGLRAVDKRQGIGRAIRNLKGDKIDLEIAKLAKRLPKDGPQAKEIYEAVVTKVFDDDHEILVDLGDYPAALLLNGKEDERYNPDAQKPSERFQIGDVVKVVAAPTVMKDETEVEEVEPVIEDEDEGSGSGAGSAVVKKEPPKKPVGRHPKHGNVRVAFAPGPEGAVVLMETKTRKVRAMVGGYDTAVGGYDRATMAKRQPGSTFKTIVYAAALADAEARVGKPEDPSKTMYTAGTIVLDAPQSIQSTPDGPVWKPKNYETGEFEGKIRLRVALAKSINEVSAQVAADLGPPAIVEMAHRLGITSELPSTISLALGAGEVTPLELINAVCTFAAGGKTAPPRFLDAIDGKALPAAEPTQAVSEQLAYVMTSMMESVVTEGTGSKAQALKIPVAGKTGTSNEEKNNWFVGLTPDYAMVVWVGYDDPKPMPHEQGAVTAVPIYVDIMKQMNLSAKPFPRPATGLVDVTIDKTTGLVANPDAPKASTMSEVYIKGTEPTEQAPLPDETTESSVVDRFD